MRAFLLQTLIEGLLCAGHCSRSLGLNGEQKDKFQLLWNFREWKTNKDIFNMSDGITYYDVKQGERDREGESTILNSVVREVSDKEILYLSRDQNPEMGGGE